MLAVFQMALLRLSQTANEQISTLSNSKFDFNIISGDESEFSPDKLGNATTEGTIQWSTKVEEFSASHIENGNGSIGAFSKFQF